MSQRERQVEKQENKEMDEEFFNNLPLEIVFEIFTKLPIRNITICKCICKSWLNLVGSDEFVKFHLSRSAPGLVIEIKESEKIYKIFSINDDLDLEHHELQYYRLSTEFIFPHYTYLQGSTNGLLFLDSRKYGDRRVSICNPITRDYIELPKVFGNGAVSSYGFGASKMSGQHKVVGIFHGYESDTDKSGCTRATKSECHVYTLGTGSWRRISASSAGDSFNYAHHLYAGAFVNGNLHWVVCDDNHEVRCTELISCFDLETEVFSTLPLPPRAPRGRGCHSRLCAVGNWLCLCERRWDEVTIWLAKEEKCWTKEFVFNNTTFKVEHSINVYRELLAPFMACNSTKTCQKFGIFDDLIREAIIYTPSFLSLKSFGIENAISL